MLEVTGKKLTNIDLHIHDVMPFGKYKGMKISVLVRTDPAYMRWFMNNVKGYKCKFNLPQRKFRYRFKKEYIDDHCWFYW